MEQKGRLPLFTSGLLSELIYSNEPAIIDNLQQRLRPDEPAMEYLKDLNFMFAFPLFDCGEGVNMNILLARNGDHFPKFRIPPSSGRPICGAARCWRGAARRIESDIRCLDPELKTVADIQRSLLPEKLPEIAGVDLGAYYQTSQRAGGDYYDFFPMPDGQWGIFIADVAGHGIAAAVMMAITHAIAHTRPGDATPPGKMLAYLNATLEKRYTGHGIIFVTAFYGVFDSKTRRLTYAAAGHPKPRLREGTVSELDGVPGLPLGIESPENYPEYEAALHSGDRLLLYTDGVSDAFNAKGAIRDGGGGSGGAGEIQLRG